MKSLVSIIVPIYNVEKYLPKCIDSLLSQTYQEVEIILVDDGSPDNCGDICDQYAKLDTRIKVIHKKNGGLSDARNVAIDIAKGEYITFVDSDDYVTVTYIESLMGMIQKYGVNVAVSLHSIFYEGNLPEINSYEVIEKKLTTNQALRAMFLQEEFDNSAWAKIYHRSLFENIRYPKDLIYEDVPTTYKLLMKSNAVAFSNVKNYYYLLRNDSIEGSPFSQKKFDSIMWIIDDLENFKKKKPYLNDFVNSRIISLLFHVFFETSQGTKYEEVLFDLIKKYRRLVIFNLSLRGKARLAIILSLSGRKFMRLFYKLNKGR